MISSVKSLIWSDWIIAQGYFLVNESFFSSKWARARANQNRSKKLIFQAPKDKNRNFSFLRRGKNYSCTLASNIFRFLTNITNFGRIWQIKQMAATIDSYETLSLAIFIYFSYFWSIRIMATRKLWQLSKRKNGHPLWHFCFLQISEFWERNFSHKTTYTLCVRARTSLIRDSLWFAFDSKSNQPIRKWVNHDSPTFDFWFDLILIRRWIMIRESKWIDSVRALLCYRPTA